MKLTDYSHDSLSALGIAPHRILPLPLRGGGPRRVRVIRTDALTDAARWALVRTIHPIHTEVSEGISEQALYDYVAAPADESFVGLVESPDGALLGFHTLRLLEVTVDGEKIIVLRAAPFMRPHVRGGAPTSAFALWSVLHITRRWPGRPMCFYGQMVTPAPYAMNAKFVRVYPGPDGAAPLAIERLRDLLNERFGHEPMPGRPWITRSFAKPPASFRTRPTSNRYVRFYLEQNPDFMAGEALTVLVRLDKKNVASLVAGAIKSAMGR